MAAPPPPSHPPSQGPLAALVASRRIIACVGSGGVGKTTTAAAVGLAGARAGRRTLVLTIDPAKRLANALGLDQLGHTPQRVPAEAPGELWAMMLDQKRAFDEIVEAYAPDPAARDRIFANTIYREISSRLTGSHEYAALSKLSEIAREGGYDLIVLDTPPTSNALDFLDAPERVLEALDSPAIHWLVKPYQETGRFSLKALSMGAAFVLGRLARFTGAQFLEDMARFFVEFQAILAGFRARAHEVFALMRQPEVAFVLVTSPEPLAVEEALFFEERLRALELRLSAFVVNRLHRVSPVSAGREAVIERLTTRSELRALDPDEVVQVAADLERSHKELSALAEADAREVERLAARGGRRAAMALVPLFDREVYDLAGLSEIAARLTG